MKTMMLRNSICAALMTATVFGGFTAPAFAATPSDQDLEAQIQEQERILAELNNKKKEARTDALQNQITSLSSQLEDLKKNSNNKYDAKGAIDALAGQIASLQEELDEGIALLLVGRIVPQCRQEQRHDGRERHQ